MAETTARPRKQRDGSTPRHPQGRHHELDRVIRVAADGEQVTVEADALTRIATGIPLIQAAGALGIRRQTIHEWRRRGVRARARQIAGETITEPDELRLIAFADKCDAAEDRGYSTEWTRHGTVAAGGLEKVTVTTRQVVGPEGEVVTLQDRKVETTLPDPRAIQWRMAVRYGVTERMRVELTGAGGGPVEMELDVVDARAASVARRFGEFLEASASEVAAPDLASGGKDPGQRAHVELPPAAPVDAAGATDPAPSARPGGGEFSAPQGPPPHSPVALLEADIPSPDVDVPAPRD
jgi:hypothetical protein